MKVLNGGGGGLSKSGTGKTKSSSPAKKSSSPKKSSSRKSSSPASPVKKSSSSSRNRKVAAVAAFTKNRAAKIIQRLTMPYKNRISINADERILTYNTYSTYFEKYNDKSGQCLAVSKAPYGNVTYTIADSIKLFKKIGSESKYGAIFLSKGTGVGSSYRFASKVMPVDDYNLNELIIMKELTRYVIQRKNPHFPVQYHTLMCMKEDNNSDLPKDIINQQYLVSLCELANGDTKMFVHKYYNDDKKIKNAIMQLLISIYSFHCLGYLHNDTHWGNFLYHRIKPGGYIKYIINGDEIYLENIGYLWVIWDFSFAVQNSDPTNMAKLTFEYKKMLVTAFMNKNMKGLLDDKYPYSQSVKDISTDILEIIEACNDQIPIKRNAHSAFFDQILNSMRENLFLKKAELPSDAIIINRNNPYRIG